MDTAPGTDPASHTAPPDTHYITLRGVNYRASVYVNGAKLTPLPDPAAASTTLPFTAAEPADPVGMFHRWTYKLPPSTPPPYGLAILVRPPDYPGNLTCPASSTEPCGQGGDHLIAMNAATQQRCVVRNRRVVGGAGGGGVLN